MPESSRFADIDVGHQLGPLELTLASAQVKRYAIAARMPGGRFMGDEEARREGMPAQIVPGNMSLALLSRLVNSAFPDATITHLSGTYRTVLHPGRPLVVHGVVTEKHCTENGNILECDLLIESPEGDRLVTGTARVRLPS